jgi:hypothetical protein
MRAVPISMRGRLMSSGSARSAVQGSDNTLRITTVWPAVSNKRHWRVLVAQRGFS